jgi:formylglycine-generating enzyme required for sulfatase activity
MARSERDLFLASQALLGAALEQVAEAPAEHIRRVAAADPELLAETLRLLQFVSSTGPESVAPEAAARGWIDDLQHAQPIDDGRYEKRGMVGKGGMGVVWRVYDRRLRRLLAMKEPRVTDGPRTDAERHLIARFLEEARVTSQLDHPGIIPVHDVGFDAQQRPCFLMRLVSGQTAGAAFTKARTEREGWTRTRALEVVLKVCDTVAYAHSRGVLHRDLKPDNVMVGAFGEVYVMDWGLAKVLDASLLAELPRGVDGPGEEDVADEPGFVSWGGQRIGTPIYMSPEQAEGLAIDQRADVYSLGAVIYELLAGQSPYADSTASSSREQTLHRVRTEPPRRIEELAKGTPAELVAIVERAMARRREDRYQSVAALATDLRAFLDHRAVVAYQTGPLVELQLWIRRNRPLAAALAAAVFLLCAGVFGVTSYAGEVRALVLRESLSKEQFRILEEEPRHPVRHDQLAALEQLVQACESYPNPQITELLESEFLQTTSGLPWGLRRRLEAVRQLHVLHRTRGADGWRRVLEELAADRRFTGYELQTDPNLIPLWRDSTSGLQWFWHPATGDEPARTPDGQVLCTEAAGLVFVLVPPGTYLRGSPLQPNPNPNPVTPEDSARIADSYEKYAMVDDDDTRQFSVTVQPFFISVWELTQAQWLRIDGDNPSRFAAGSASDARPPKQFSGLHPVENVSAVVARARLAMFGLEFPSESQWEYAYRAGTTTRWFTGELPQSLYDRAAVPRKLYANIADRALFDLISTRQPKGWFAPYDDGYPYHAPVDVLSPNAWGLVGMAGNVWEWCADVYDHDAHLHAVGDQPSLVGGDRRVLSIRGGSWNSPVREATATERWHKFVNFISPELGVRPIKRARW